MKVNSASFFFLGASIFLHAVLARCFFAGREQRPPPESRWRIAWIALPPPEPQKPAPSRSRRPRLPTLSARDLSLATVEKEQLGFFRTPRLEGSENAGSGHADTAGPAETRLRTTGLFQYLHDRIEDELDYPAELARAGIEGIVSGTLSFSARGNFLAAASPLRSESPYLRVLVARTLRHAFGRGPVVPIARAGNSLRFPVSFRFTLTTHPELTVLQLPGSPTSPVAERGVAMAPDPIAAGRPAPAALFCFERIYNRLSSVRLLLSEDRATGGKHYQPGIDILPLIEQAGDWLADWLRGRARLDALDTYRQDPSW